MARKSMAQLQAFLHRQLGEAFVARLASGEYTANDLNVIRQWLKDNGVTGDPERPSADTLDLAKKVAELDLEPRDLH